MLNLIESLDFLKKHKQAKWKIITKHRHLKNFHYPAFLKVDTNKHKSKIKAIESCKNLKEAEKNLVSLHKKFPKNKIIIQEKVEGLELIIGIKQEKVFGKIMLLGMGGTNTEKIKDVTFRKLPVSKNEIRSMLNDIKGIKSINKKNFAVKKLTKLIYKISKLAVKNKIIEMDLNPIILNKKNAFIVDARISIQKEII